MKTKLQLILLLICILNVPNVFAYDFTCNGIAYNILKDGTLSVTHFVKEKDVWNSEEMPRYSGDLVIPSNVTYKGKKYKVSEIGSCALVYSNKLKSLKVSEGITKICRMGIGYCYNLVSVSLPSSINKLEPAFSFHSMKIATIDINPKNKYYKSVNNCVYNKNMTELILVGPKIRRYTIPSSVTSIADFAFVGVKLNKLVIPKTVKHIAKDALNMSSIGWGDVINETNLNPFGYMKVTISDEFKKNQIK